MRCGRFQAYTGLDGFMLAKLTAGMSPQPSPFEALTELLLMPIFRGVALVYLKVKRSPRVCGTKRRSVVRRHAKRKDLRCAIAEATVVGVAGGVASAQGQA